MRGFPRTSHPYRNRMELGLIFSRQWPARIARQAMSVGWDVQGWQPCLWIIFHQGCLRSTRASWPLLSSPGSGQLRPHGKSWARCATSRALPSPLHVGRQPVGAGGLEPVSGGVGWDAAWGWAQLFVRFHAATWGLGSPSPFVGARWPLRGWPVSPRRCSVDLWPCLAYNSDWVQL